MHLTVQFLIHFFSVSDLMLLMVARRAYDP